MSEEPREKPSHFIRDAVVEDLQTGRFKGVVTRFPPEPNGYLHIGHAKAIALDFGLALQFGGRCHLRFDDTNPAKESQEYVDAIMCDVRWLGFDWGAHLYYASDYFQQLYDWAVQLIRAGHAYVDDLSADQVAEYRGTLTQPGKESPYRNRSVAENLDLFERMRRGEFPDGTKTLRAKIDMAAGNLNLRDPVMYRIRKTSHHRTGDAWCIYPLYDWAHGQSDSIEGVTHSLCTLEYEDHRPLYDWYLDALGIYHPRQIEFARLNLSHTVMSKRRLLTLVEEGLVSGWDDPRMPTLAGLRRRGYTPEAIRDFCERIGIAKADNLVDVALLEHCVREDLNRRALRRMAVLRPLRRCAGAQGEGDHPLGLGVPFRPRRGAPVRQPLLGPQARRGRGLQVCPEQALARGAHRVPSRALPRRRGARVALPVRAPGVLLRRLARVVALGPGPQPHRRAPRHLGEDREGRRALSRSPDEPRATFFSLTPDRVLEAVEVGGLRCTGRCLPRSEEH